MTIRWHDTVEVDVTQGWQTLGRSTRDRRRKKTRPQRSAGNATKPVAQERSDAPRPAASGSGWRSAPARASSVAQTIRAEDYHYVYSDLRRIAVMAISLFIVLIALSFIIR